MIGVHSDAMKAVAGHHAFGAQRVRGGWWKAWTMSRQ